MDELIGPMLVYAMYYMYRDTSKTLFTGLLSLKGVVIYSRSSNRPINTCIHIFRNICEIECLSEQLGEDHRVKEIGSLGL